jgi:Superoxide dismutase
MRDAPNLESGASRPFSNDAKLFQEAGGHMNLYKPLSFNLSHLTGISDKTLETHFKLYEGYVKETNRLNGEIAELLGKGHVDQENFPAYSELKRRLGFEYNGMVLHEYYFANLKKHGGGDPKSSSGFYRQATKDFGDYKTWKADFVGTGKMRGVGWSICYQDPVSGRLSNHWITLHETGNVAGFHPIVVMDVWEHAFIFDYKPAERPKYIEAFFANMDWDAIDQRLVRIDPKLFLVEEKPAAKTGAERRRK